MCLFVCQGSREDETTFQCFRPRDTPAGAFTCEQVPYHEEV